MKSLSLRRFIFILSTTSLILPALLAGIYNSREVQRYVQSSLQKELATQVSLVSSKVGLVTDSMRKLLQRDILLIEARVEPESQSIDEIQSVLDEMAEKTGSQFTFLRPKGETLERVATTISSSVTGRSAVGTTLRKESPAYESVNKGLPFKGKSTILGIPHSSMYTPLKDKTGQLEAVLFTGIADKTFLAPILEELKGEVIGESGYFFVLDSEGNYILSPGGAFDGKNIEEILIPEEQADIRDMITAAMASPLEQNTGSYRHYLQGDDKGRMKAAVYTYIPEYDWFLAASDYSDRARGTIINSLKMLMMIMAAALLVGIAINLALNRVLRKTFLRVESALEDVAGGDLRFSEGSRGVFFSEFVSLMETLGNRIIPRLKELINQIESGTTQSSTMSEVLEFNIIQSISSLNLVEDSSSAISAESVQLNALMDSAEESSANIKVAVQSLEEQITEQSSSITEITASIEEMSASLKSVALVAGEKLKTAEDLKKQSLLGMAQLENTKQLIQQTNEDSRAIISFLDIINDISERISLLAMNAAIEAAHAGESGRGFAIVAGEMRSLAESTAENGRKIKETLGLSMENMAHANEQSINTTVLIRSVNDEIESFTSAFQEIVDSTSEISAGSVQILEGANSLQESSSITLTESTNINGEAGQLSYSIEETKKSSERNVGIAEKLQFLLSGLNDCQTEMLSLGKYNRDIGGVLMEKIKAFDYEREAGDTMIIDVIRSHQDWEDRIYWHLTGDTILTVDQIVDHHSCALGQWLAAHKDWDKGNNFETLLKLHEMFHDCMRTIVMSEDQSLEGEDFSRLVSLSHQVIRLLLSLLGYDYEGESSDSEEQDAVEAEIEAGF